MGSVARAIRAALHLTRDAEDLLLRVDGYAVSSRGDASVLRDGDVVHVSARDNHAHGGPWPLSPAAAAGAPAVTPDPNAATGKRPRAPHDAPPAPLSPADPDPTRDPSDDPEDAALAATAPGTDPDSTRSRSARRKALKRARARCAKYGTPMNVETRPSAKKSATEEGKEEEAARRRARANKPTETRAKKPTAGARTGVG